MNQSVLGPHPCIVSPTQPGRPMRLRDPLCSRVCRAVLGNLQIVKLVEIGIRFRSRPALNQTVSASTGGDGLQHGRVKCLSRQRQSSGFYATLTRTFHHSIAVECQSGSSQPKRAQEGEHRPKKRSCFGGGFLHYSMTSPTERSAKSSAASMSMPRTTVFDNASRRGVQS